MSEVGALSCCMQLLLIGAVSGTLHRFSEQTFRWCCAWLVVGSINSSLGDTNPASRCDRALR